MLRYLKRKRHKPRDPLPGWAKWAVLAFIAYAVFINPQREKSHVKDPAQKTASSEVARAVNEQVSQYQAEFSKFGVLLRTEDILAGSGDPVVCGQDVALSYEAFDEGGNPLGDTQPSYRLRLGEGKAMRALEQGIEGMRVGGKRTIIARNGLAYGDTRPDLRKDAQLRFAVSVLSATPDVSKFNGRPFRALDAVTGTGNAAACGEHVHIQATVWGANGQKLFETKEPVTFTLGKSEVALGIEQGVIGMRSGGLRTLIIPPALQKPMHAGNLKHAFGLPQAQIVIVDVSVGH